MTDEEQYTDVDISDVIEDTENLDSEIPNTELTELTDIETLESFQDTELNIDVQNEKKTTTKIDVTKTRLPLARIKNIIKMDPDVHLVNAEAVFLVTKATELFLETISKEAYNYSKKKKLISKKDLDNVIDTVDCLCFLEGAMDF